MPARHHRWLFAQHLHMLQFVSARQNQTHRHNRQHRRPHATERRRVRHLHPLPTPTANRHVTRSQEGAGHGVGQRHDAPLHPFRLQENRLPTATGCMRAAQ